MIDLAIVIGVSEYGAPNDLPGCKNDAKAIHMILASDSKFEEILMINSDTTASSLKSRLSEFVERFKGQEVNDLVFYFTGHGEFHQDEFYFLPTDYDSSRRKRTSLENSELDTYLRSLAPKLTVKIIDACQSGVRYVKDPELIPKYLETSKTNFDKCYFFFSSQSNEASYQDSSLSFFTRAIVESVASHTEKTIRYKDVSDYCADYFNGKNDQTPFFVQQADLTEVFLALPDNIVGELRSFTSLGTSPEPKLVQSGKSLLELIKDDAKRYCTKASADESLQELAKLVTTEGLPSQLKDLFTISKVEETDFGNMPDPTSIGKFVSENRQRFFAKPFYHTFKVRKQVPKNPLLGTVASLLEDGMKEITVNENRIVGFRPTTMMPYLYLIVQAEPKFENLQFHECYIVPIISKTEIQLFTIFCRYFDTSWDNRELDGAPKWETWSCELKDEKKLRRQLEEVMGRFWNFVLNPLKQRYLPAIEKAGAAPPSSTKKEKNSKMKKAQ